MAVPCSTRNARAVVLAADLWPNSALLMDDIGLDMHDRGLLSACDNDPQPIRESMGVLARGGRECCRPRRSVSFGEAEVREYIVPAAEPREVKLVQSHDDDHMARVVLASVLFFGLACWVCIVALQQGQIASRTTPSMAPGESTQAASLPAPSGCFGPLFLAEGLGLGGAPPAAANGSKACCASAQLREQMLDGFGSGGVDAIDRVKLRYLMGRNATVTFYDSRCGIQLFVAPTGRTFQQFWADNDQLGWLSFRNEEALLDNLEERPGGDIISKCDPSERVGRNLPDDKGNRYSIGLSCTNGSLQSEEPMQI